jgi:nucleoside-diphosphate-sugar epimerase
VNDVLRIVAGYVGPLKIRREERQAGDARHTRADTSKALAALNFRPAVTLEEGIGQEVEWLRAELKA